MIRWTKNQKQNLSKAVKRWNAKLAREVRKNPDLIDVPGLRRLSVKELKQDITSAKDLNRQIKEIDRAFKKGAWEVLKSDKGALTTKHQLQTFKINLRTANRRQSKIRDNIITPGDERIKKVSYVPQYKVDFKTISSERWEKLLNTANNLVSTSFESKRQEQMKKRYIKAIKSTIGVNSPELLEIIQQLPAELIDQNMFDTHELGLMIFYEEQLDSEQRAEMILQSWFERLQGTGYFSNFPNLDVLPKEGSGPEEAEDNEGIDESENWILEDERNQWIY